MVSARTRMQMIFQRPHLTRLLCGGGPPTIEIEPLRYIPIVTVSGRDKADGRYK